MLPIELHIWAPGFGLPSIDAECLAAIAYLRRCLPEGLWTLIASSDPKVSPFAELPALRHGERWVARYSNIKAYLRDTSHGDWDLDRHLNRAQRADCAAFTSFIESRGQPLLDLSLYVSSENYNNHTKTALGDILAWPSSWTVPGQLRRKARKRSEHLGLSSLDVDAAQESEDKDKALSAQIPKALRKPKQTVSAVLGRNASKNRFRLDAVAIDFLEPLDELLDQEQYFLGDSVTSLDCLAVAYLSLIQQPDLSHDWLRVALREKYPKLGKWTKSARCELFQHGLDTDKEFSSLPWQIPSHASWSETGMALVESIVESMPIIGRYHSIPQINVPFDSSIKVYEMKQRLVVGMRRKEWVLDQIVGSLLGIGACVGLLAWFGLLKLPKSYFGKGKRDFGAAGAMLGLG